MQAQEIAQTIAEILDEKQAKEIKIIKIGDLTVLADFFVVATGNSSTHVKTLSDEVEFQMAKKGLRPLYQDTGAKNWKALDYTFVIAHVFDDDARKFYNLEHLWADAEIIPFERDEK